MQRLQWLSAAAIVLATAAFAAAQFTVVNGTHFAVLAVQAKPSGTAVWQPDLLEQKTLGIGKLRGVALPAGASCNVDFLATLDDGHKVLIRNDNVCTNRALPITDDRK